MIKNGVNPKKQRLHKVVGVLPLFFGVMSLISYYPKMVFCVNYNSIAFVVVCHFCCLIEQIVSETSALWSQ